MHLGLRELELKETVCFGKIELFSVLIKLTLSKRKMVLIFMFESLKINLQYVIYIRLEFFTFVDSTTKNYKADKLDKIWSSVYSSARPMATCKKIFRIFFLSLYYVRTF